jgi:Holliday junction resolvase RusA-like endonuclease
MQVKFTILGEPKGKGRPRFSRKTGTAITPKDTVNYETLVHMEYLEQCNGFRFEDDAMLDLRIKAYYSIPKSASKKKRLLCWLERSDRPRSRIWTMLLKL